jgi:16S rRNA (adenine1518-N6/adenine1519-N6)-dimethyltransferase
METTDVHLPSPRRILLQYGFEQRRRLGQCFLDNHRTLDAIVDAAKLEPAMPVIEIGAGPGYLTARIRRRTARLAAVELDERYRPVHQEYFGGLEPPVRFIYGDALALDWAGLLGEFGGAPYVVMGNIPYQITTPLIEKLLNLSPLPERIVLLVQVELAQRLSAQPGRKSYGALTVKVGVVATVRQAIFVPRQRFQPRPRVDSAAIVIEPRRPPLVAPGCRAKVFGFVNAAFAHRRKKIINSLLDSGYAERERLEEAFRQAAVDPGRRPETLSIEEFIALADAMAAA